MIFGSVCSGIEAASAAWVPLGWECAFMSEIAPFPRAVLKHHYPETPLHGDFTTIESGQYRSIDLLVGGTPCQSFSVAGLRGGLGDDRGNLALEFLRLAQRTRPRWLVWENVPGVLSSLSYPSPDPRPPPNPVDLGCDGAEVESDDDFDSEELHALECFLAGLSELGYGFAYRILDAQFFRLPQRRKRLFVVGYLGDWRPAVSVLFEREGLSGNPPPSRQTRQDLAPTLAARARGGGGLGTDFDCDGGLIPSPAMDLPDLRRGEHRDERGPDGAAADVRMVRPSDPLPDPGGLIAHTLRPPSNRAAWRGDGADNLVAEPVAGTLRGHPRPGSNSTGAIVAAFGGNNTIGPLEVATAVNAHGGPHGRQDFESETFVVAQAFKASHFTRGKDGAPSDIAPPLSADADKGDQDTLLVVHGSQDPDVLVDLAHTLGQNQGAENALAFRPKMGLAAHGSMTGDVIAGPLQESDFKDPQVVAYAAPPIAFTAKDHGADAGELSPTLRSGSFDESHANGGVMPAIAFALRGREEGNVPEAHGDLVSALRSASGGSTRDFVAFNPAQLTHPENRSNPQIGDPAPTLAPTAGAPAVAFTVSQNANGFAWEGEVAPALQSFEAGESAQTMSGVRQGWQVRRLTPLECCRLQGFPDDYLSQVTFRGAAPKDGPMYAALGNSMAVPCMRWIGERIATVDALVRKA